MIRPTMILWLAVPLTLLGSAASAEELLFEHKFENCLSLEWKVVGLKDQDFRIRTPRGTAGGRGGDFY